MRTDTTSDMRELLEENIKISKEILKTAQSTHRYMRMAQIVSVIKILAIIVPLIFAFIYLPPYIQKLTQTFSGLYGGDQYNILEQLKGVDTSGINISDVLQKFNQK